jgi:hypothetical protein
VSQAYQQSLVAASLYIDYIFLDTDERRKMAQNPHEYLIEQLQFTGDSLSVLPVTRSSSISTTPVRSLSGLSSLMLT